MKTVTLSGSLRTNVGRVDATALRNKGHVPCVLYGGKEQIHFHADAREFKPVIYTPESCLVQIKLGEKEYTAILKESQYHKITDKLIHADFLEVISGKAVEMEIPIKLNGQSEGVKDGGRLVQKARKLKVSAMIEKLPQYIEINIEKLSIGKSVLVSDLNYEGVTFLHPKSLSVVGVQVTRAVVEEVKVVVAAPVVAAAAKDEKKPAGDKKAPAEKKK
jgi:large subunit ribosomal protein L25